MKVLRKFPFLKRSCILAIAALLWGCAQDEKPFIEKPLFDLFREGYDSFHERSYEAACDAFEEVEVQYPGLDWVAKSRLFAAYAAYKGRLYERAERLCETFIQAYPYHPSLVYAYFLRALACYHQINPIPCDNTQTYRAYEVICELEDRFGGSPYVQALRGSKRDLREHLAGKQLYLARFYQDRKDFIAALRHFRVVANRYPELDQAAEALFRLMECAYALGLNKEKELAFSRLRTHFPKSAWTKRAAGLMR